MEQTITCINCPVGCRMTVRLSDSGEVLSVTGNTCPRGEKYAKNEAVCPKRTVTSTVAVRGGAIPRLSVKTAQDIPKDKIGAVMEAINAAQAQAPVVIGEVLIADVAGTGVDVVATAHAV